MKIKSVWLLLTMVTATYFTEAQSLFHLQYKLPGDTSTWSAFFMASSNGSGVVRYKKNNSKDLAEMEIVEQYATGNDGQPDTTLVIYEGMNPKKISGIAKRPGPPVNIWFKQNEAGAYAPWAVTLKANMPAPTESNIITTELLLNETMVNYKPLVLSYFDTASAVYQNYYGKKSGSKGSNNWFDQHKIKMFLVVVASTRDSSLMPNPLLDARKVVDEFTEIAENELGITLLVDSIYGSRYNKAAVEDAINNRLKPGKEDIVVFYYTGHGFSDRKKPANQFPFLDLRDPNNRPRPDARTQTINIQDIYNSIIKKGARLNLVLSDCCNDTIEAKKPKSILPPPTSKGPVKYSYNNLHSLFMSKTRMNLLMTAASRDERAIITPRYSSYFTYFFIESLRTYLGPMKANPNWYQVMEDAKKQTTLFAGKVPCPNGRNCLQTPRMLVAK
jgi:Caspase domain